MSLLNLISRCISTSLVALFAGCGGASVHVTPMGEYERPTSTLISELSTANNEERKSLLASLTGTRGYRLDWADFWSRLRHCEASAKIWADNKEQLRPLALAAKSCRVDGYQALARFIISRDDGWDWLLGSEKLCNATLGPEIATWLIAYLADQPSKVSSYDLIEFFIFELEGESNPQKWLPYWNLATEEQLVKSYQSLRGENSVLRMRLRMAFRAVWNRELRGDIPGILELPIDLVNLLHERESVEALEYIVRIARGVEPPQKLSGMMAVEQVTAVAFAQHAPLEKHWSHYLLLRNLLSHCGRTWDVSERLLHRDQLMKAFSKQVNEFARSQEISAFFRARLEETWDAPTFMELATFALTYEGTQSVFAKELSSRGLNRNQQAFSVEENLLRLRFQIQWADTLNTRDALIQKFCETLRSVGARTGKLVPLAELANMTSVPGCFVVKAAAKASIQTQQEISLSFFSFLDFQTRELLIHTPAFYAGVVQIPDGARVEVRARKLGTAVVVTSGSGSWNPIRDE